MWPVGSYCLWLKSIGLFACRKHIDELVALCRWDFCRSTNPAEQHINTLAWGYGCLVANMSAWDCCSSGTEQCRRCWQCAAIAVYRVWCVLWSRRSKARGVSARALAGWWRLCDVRWDSARNSASTVVTFRARTGCRLGTVQLLHAVSAGASDCRLSAASANSFGINYFL
jgi:hypothetical protein